MVGNAVDVVGDPGRAVSAVWLADVVKSEEGEGEDVESLLDPLSLTS